MNILSDVWSAIKDAVGLGKSVELLPLDDRYPAGFKLSLGRIAGVSEVLITAHGLEVTRSKKQYRLQ